MKKRNNRRKFQSVDIVMGLLRELARKETTPAWIMLAAIDRMAEIDGIYKVNLDALRPARLPQPPAPEPEPLEPVKAEDTTLLDEFNKRFYDKGGALGKPTDSKN